MTQISVEHLTIIVHGFRDHHRTSDQYSGVDVTSALQAFALLRERTRGKRDITTSVSSSHFSKPAYFFKTIHF